MVEQPIRAWVLYDDSCGFCRRWVPFWEATLRRHGFAVAPLQAGWVRERLGLPNDELLADIRLLTVAGGSVRGADVYRYVMRRIWWSYPLYLLSVAPIGGQVFDFAYRLFAMNRFRVSRACGLRGV